MNDDMLNKIHNRCIEKNYTFCGFVNDKYENNKSKLVLQCNKDSYKWQPTYTSFIDNKTGCPKCYGKIKKSKDEMMLDILNTCSKKGYRFIEFMGKELNSKSKFSVQCLKDYHIWQPSYNNFIIKNSGCPVCGDTLMRTEESAMEIIIKTCNNKNYTFDGFVGNYYSGAKVKLNLKCNHCNCEWMPAYYNFIHNNSGCPNCRKSKGELIIAEYLKERNIEFFQQKTFKECKDKRLLRFDFYLPLYNMCIEFDGSQHFISKKVWGGDNHLKIIKIHDDAKNMFCIENNISLLRINYKENVINKLISVNII